MIKIEVKDDATQIMIAAQEAALTNLRPFFANFWSYMHGRTMLMFSTLKRGGRYRGVRWPGFAPQYTRKDGTIVPAEGGVAKVRGKGKVKGRLRGGGRAEKDRVTRTSNLMRHNGVLYGAALTDVRYAERKVTMDTPVNYARAQNAMRPFQFFETPKDVQMAARMFRKYVNG